MVGGGGAAGQQQFGKCYLHGEFQAARGEPCPDGVEVLQPREKGSVGHWSPGAGERLVEVVVRVDQARQDDVRGGVELGAGNRRAASGGH